ncbi:tetratricopeptide repeat protein [Candidatus Pelagibacter sp.]|nr:tetratricopeptide repeat protein [Candidatus Pelagibacter sp.]
MTVDQIMQQAKLLLNESKLKEAKILFLNILQIQPTHYKAHTNLGAILLKLGKLDEAEVSFKKAIEFKPEFAVAHYNLGVTQEKLNRFNEAEISYKKAIEYKTDYVEAHTNLGAILLKLGKLDEAEVSFKKAIEFKPEFAVAHYNLGVTQEKLNRFNEAEISYKKAIEYKTDYVEAHNNLNMILRQNKLLLKIEQAKNSEKKIKVSNLDTDISLATNPFISKRNVEIELLDELYKINSVELDKTRDIRYGNGRCSDYELFENNSSILQTVEKDLTYIMSQAVKSDIYIIESFFNILRAGSGLTSHKHLNNFDKTHNLINKKYSLTYYLSVGDQNCSKPGILKLYDPDEEILPSEGTIVIFPADRNHSAAYGGKIDRVMIGVNFYSLT